MPPFHHRVPRGYSPSIEHGNGTRVVTAGCRTQHLSIEPKCSKISPVTVPITRLLVSTRALVVFTWCLTPYDSGTNHAGVFANWLVLGLNQLPLFNSHNCMKGSQETLSLLVQILDRRHRLGYPSRNLCEIHYHPTFLHMLLCRQNASSRAGRTDGAHPHWGRRW